MCPPSCRPHRCLEVWRRALFAARHCDRLFLSGWLSAASIARYALGRKPSALGTEPSGARAETTGARVASSGASVEPSGARAEPSGARVDLAALGLNRTVLGLNLAAPGIGCHTDKDSRHNGGQRKVLDAKPHALPLPLAKVSEAPWSS